MRQHLREALRVDALARRSGMSPRSFARRFKLATGQTPLAYLHGLRIEAAKQLLERSERSLREVAEAVGYEDVAFFRALFKRRSGAAPAVWRRRFARPRRVAHTDRASEARVVTSPRDPRAARAWDERAREDPLYWSCVRERWRGSRDVEGCLELGTRRRGRAARADPRAHRLRGARPAPARLGAGFGRMFRGYHELGFGAIVGAEISSRWRGSACAGSRRGGARFVAIDGASLACFGDGRFDACISRGVLPYQRDERACGGWSPRSSACSRRAACFLLHFGGRRGGGGNARCADAPGLGSRRGTAARTRARAGRDHACAAARARAATPVRARPARPRGLAGSEAQLAAHPRYYVSGRKPDLASAKRAQRAQRAKAAAERSECG